MSAEVSPLATKADLQRQTLVLVMWIVGTQAAVAVIMIVLCGVFYYTFADSSAPQAYLT